MFKSTDKIKPRNGPPEITFISFHFFCFSNKQWQWRLDLENGGILDFDGGNVASESIRRVARCRRGTDRIRRFLVTEENFACEHLARFVLFCGGELKGVVGETNLTIITLLVHCRADVLVDAHVFVDVVRLGRLLIGDDAPKHREMKARYLLGNGDCGKNDNPFSSNKT